MGLRANVGTSMAVIVATVVLYNYAMQTRFGSSRIHKAFSICDTALNLHAFCLDQSFIDYCTWNILSRYPAVDNDLLCRLGLGVYKQAHEIPLISRAGHLFRIFKIESQNIRNKSH